MNLDLIVPVYNEQVAVVEKTVNAVRVAFERNKNLNLNIYVVNDGSDSQYNLSKLSSHVGINYIEHPQNRGYGAALKTGILSGNADFIAITDADGTYPIENFPKLAEDIEHYDMCTGIRVGPVKQVPWLRRFPKLILNTLASYLAGTRIRDLNSGMRIFRRDLAYYLWGLFPNGFSFTSTITMGALLGGFRIREVPINYFKREGSSSMKPIRDTVYFFRLVFRLGLVFAPHRLFTPIALSLSTVGIVKGLMRDYILLGYVGNLSITLMLAGLQIYMLGVISNLIVLNRRLSFNPAHAIQSGKTEGVEIVPAKRISKIYYK